MSTIPTKPLDKLAAESNDVRKLLDSDELPTKEMLEAVDFSNKSPELKKLDAEILAQRAKELSEAKQAPAANIFRSLYFLTYKHLGPIENVLFSSFKHPAVIARDCQIWCKRKGYRYIGYKKAVIDINDTSAEMTQETGAPAGDITEIVTRQSRDPKFHKAV